MRHEFSKPTKREALKPSAAPEYRAWVNMKSRCYNPKTPGFHRYGGRGIMVCEEWRRSFETFVADMGPRPTPWHTVERIDGDKGYEPSNCRWATRAEQANNLSTNHLIRTDDGDVALSSAARSANLKPNTVTHRLRRGWSPEQALTLPLRQGKRP